MQNRLIEIILSETCITPENKPTAGGNRNVYLYHVTGEQMSELFKFSAIRFGYVVQMIHTVFNEVSRTYSTTFQILISPAEALATVAMMEPYRPVETARAIGQIQARTFDALKNGDTRPPLVIATQIAEIIV